MKWHHVNKDDYGDMFTACGRPVWIDVLITNDWDEVTCLQCKATLQGRRENGKSSKNSLDAGPEAG